MAESDYRRLAPACHCGRPTKPKLGASGRQPMYCRQACKQKAYEARHPSRPKKIKQPTLCAYFAKHCTGCGAAGGARRDWSRCHECIRRDGLAAARLSHRLMCEAKHKAAGLVAKCGECSCSFCPTYGYSHATLCQVCAAERLKASNRASKAARKARERRALVDRVDPFVVFERDGWACRMCGTHTPREKRGTYEPDAPELDHIKPLSKGGEHSYANTQCCCRRCNGIKSDRYEECEA
jgi:5-methylcytosine-specific restriction endonuclease McrA